MDILHFKEFLTLSEEYIRKPNSQLGSNPGGIFTDSSDIDHYIKFPRDPDQAKVEVATSRIFNHLGIRTLSPTIETAIPNKIGVKTKWDNNLARIQDTEFEDHINDNPKFRTKMLDLYHTSALMANHDCLGQEKDNVLLDKRTKELVSVDQGGSMHFRAMGGSKEFNSHEVPELESLLVKHRPAGQVFSHAISRSTPEEIQASRDKLKELTDSHIDSIIVDSGLNLKHAETIKARRDIILGK